MSTTVLSARKVLCLDSADTSADWVAFEDGRITAIGNGEPASADRNVSTDGVVLPGFIDAHVHLTSTGIFRTGLECRDCRSVNDLLSRVGDFMRKTDSKWIVAGAFDPGRNADARMPDRQELDSVSADRVLVVTRTDGHSSTLNSAALDALDPDLSLTGTELDDRGQPTGRLSNIAHYTTTRKFYSQLPVAEIRKAQLAACSLALEKGVTSIHEMGGASNQDSDVLLDSLSELPIHVKPYLATLDVSRAIDAGLDCVGGDLPLDGSIGSRTAAMSEPYEDAEGSGSLYRSDEELVEFFVEATRAGVQAGLHAIGDAAINQVVRCIEGAMVTLGPEGSVGSTKLRHRIEHFECASTEIVERAVALRIVPSIQPVFDLYWGGTDGMYAARLGKRAFGMNPFSVMARMGMTLAGGSDSPVTPLDPLLGVGAAMNHRRREFAVPFDQAVRMFTIWGATAAREEEERGSVEIGKAADFCVLSDDPSATAPENIPGLRVLQTWVRGEMSFEL